MLRMAGCDNGGLTTLAAPSILTICLGYKCLKSQVFLVLSIHSSSYRSSNQGAFFFGGGGGQGGTGLQQRGEKVLFTPCPYTIQIRTPLPPNQKYWRFAPGSNKVGHESIKLIPLATPKILLVYLFDNQDALSVFRFSFNIPLRIS